MDTVTLVKKLEKFPHIKIRLENMLEVAENSSGEWELADDVEMKICAEINKMGLELLTLWSKEQEQYKATKASSDATKHSKKNFTGAQP